jgi:hypothetical protein
MEWKIDKAANFVYVQLVVHESAAYDEYRPDYARQD